MLRHKLALGRVAVLLLLVGGSLSVLQAAPMPSNTVYLPAATRGVPAVLATSRAQARARFTALNAFRRLLIQRHAISPRAVLPRFDTFVVTPPAQRAATPVSYGNGLLTFAYSGWTAQEESDLRTFLQQAYPILVNLYGAPAQTATLTLVQGSTQPLVEGGEFNPTTMTLTLDALPADFATTDSSQYGLGLLHLVLHAFHAPVIMGCDAWEEGMARAAAAVAMLQMRPDFPLVYAMDYLLPLYDELNQPALSSASFFPQQGLWQMSLWRVGMAMSAWLKIYAEKPEVFKTLNGVYYAQLTQNAAFPRGDINSLEALLAGVLPSVEGRPFAAWYADQYALLGATVTGRRLYLFPVPLDDNLSLQIYSFSTSAGGSETPVAATANLTYFSYDLISLSPEEGNTVTIPGSGDNAGLGLINPSFYNIGSTPTQRIQVEVTVDTLQARCYFPYAARGPDNNENQFFGTVVGANDGNIQFTVPGIPLTAIPVVQGAFSQRLPNGDLTFFTPVKIDYLAADSTVTTYRRNVGPGFYVPQLLVTNTPTILSHTFLAGTSLVSFPIAPSQTDIGQLGGLNSDAAFRFSWWDPYLTDANKYREYPALQTPVVGRGYWLRVTANTTVNVAGAQPATDDPRVTTIAAGWNMIGNTYNAPLNPWAMTIQVGATVYAMTDAIGRGIVGPVWGYDPTQKTYQIKGTLDRWEGGWIYNTTGGDMQLGQRGATRGARNGVDVAQVLGTGGWVLNLQASSSAVRDTAAYLGVSTNAATGTLNWRKPPATGEGIRLAFITPNARTAGAAYATDIRRDIRPSGEQWEFEVTSSRSDLVTVSWPDLRAAPTSYTLTLQDTTTGNSQYLRTTGAYVYQASGTPAHPDTRRFLLTVAPRTGTPLSFVHVNVIHARGAGVSVQVATNRPADLVLDIRSPVGKLIRTITIPAARATQPIIIPWDGRATGGKLVPSGTYLINLTARTAEGFCIRRSDMVQLRM